MYLALFVRVVLAATVPDLADLTSTDFATRNRALDAVLRQPGRSEPGLLKLAGSEDERTRFYALFALSRIGSVKAVEALAKALADESGSIREFAARELYRLKQYQPILDALSGIQSAESVRRALCPLAPEPLRAKLEGMLMRSQPNRDVILRLIGSTRSREAAKAVSSCLTDADPLVRAAAAEALGLVGSAEQIPELQALLSDPDEETVVAAALSLEKLGDRAVKASLLGLLGSDKEVTRQHAAVAFGRLFGSADPSKSLATLKPLLASASPRDRAAAVEAIGLTGSPYVTASLLQTLTDENGEVRRRAIKALRRLTPSNLYTRLASLPTAGDVAARDGFVRLARILIPRFEDEQQAGELIRNTVLELAGLERASPDDRILAALALAQLGDRSREETIADAIRHDNEWVRLGALDALWRTRSGKLPDAVDALLADPSAFVRRRALYYAGQAKLKVLGKRVAQIMTDDMEWSFVRSVAASSLPDTLGTDAIQLLRSLQDTEDEELRLAVLSSLLYLEQSDAGPKVAELLVSTRPTVAAAAHQVLELHTGRTTSFDPTLPPHERLKYVAEWLGILKGAK